MADKPMLYIHGFGTEWVPDFENYEVIDPRYPGKVSSKRRPTGKMKGRDWVEYSPIGSVQKTRLREWIELIDKPMPLTGRGGENPAIQMANLRWDTIRPRYEAWKSGQEVPVDGIPLAAWNGVSRQLADLLRTHGVTSVQDLAALSDTHIQTMNIMGLRSHIENAKRFILAQDKVEVASALERKDQEIAELRAQMAELVEMVKENKPEAPKRRGRPPKVSQVSEIAQVSEVA